MKEKRYITVDGLQLRGDGDSRLISGRAIVFNSDSSYMGYIERVLPTAITQETINNSDIFMLYNHDDNNVLARSNHGNGTLMIERDDEGVSFLFEAPNTSLGNDMLELVKRGDLTSCSFCFSWPDDSGCRWYRDNDNQLRCDIHTIGELYDLSIVNTPAYPATSVSARAQRKLQEIEAIDRELDAKLEEINKL